MIGRNFICGCIRAEQTAISFRPRRERKPGVYRNPITAHVSLLIITRAEGPGDCEKSTVALFIAPVMPRNGVDKNELLSEIREEIKISTELTVS